MTVNIILDSYNIEKGDEFLHVNSQSDHILALHQIDDSVDSGIDLRIAVHNRAMFSWFDHYRSRKEISISLTDPCRELADLLGTTTEQLPTELRQDPWVIVKEGILDQAKRFPRSSNEDIFTWLLKTTLGTIWADAHLLHRSQMTSLIEEYAFGRASNDLHPTILGFRDQKIQHWVNSGTPYSNVVQWLFKSDPCERARALILRKVVEGYPHQVQIDSLQFGGRWAQLSELEDMKQILDVIDINKAHQLQIPSSFSQVINDHLETALENRNILSIIECLSGVLRCEEHAIQNYLKKHNREIDFSWTEVLMKILEKFSTNVDNLHFTKYVRKLIPTPAPSSLDSNSRWDNVSAWLTGEYLPFYYWCSSVSRIEDTVEREREFENWLVKNYDSISRTNAYAPYALRGVISSYIGTNPIAIIIVDGMSWENAGVLRNALALKDIKCLANTGHIGAIPTETRLSKPSLIAGKIYSQIDPDEETDEYASLLATVLNIEEREIGWGNSSTTSLEDLTREPKKAYLFLYNEIDGVIHKAMSPESRQQHIERILADIASEISAAASNFQSFFHKELFIIISSDHGYSELPGEVQLVKLPQPNSCSISHGRVAECQSDRKLTISDLHCLDEGITGNKGIIYFVSKGYSCIESKPRGAVHGGLTPQEVFAPIIVGSRMPSVEFLELEIALTGEVRRGRVNNEVYFHVVNPNTVAVAVTEIQMSLFNVTYGIPSQILGGSKAKVNGNINGESLTNRKIELNGRIKIDFLGAIQTQEFKLTMETSGAAVASKSFEEEFEV